VYKGIHQGQRCFIVGNAPSINQLDMSLLRGEIVFSVSSGYHHPLYDDYMPRYHCVPQLTFSNLITEQVVIDWFREMHTAIGKSELFLSTTEYDFVLRHGLFTGRKVNYVGMYKRMDIGTLNVDLTDLIYGVQSVPIMVLQIALYMGFSKIYMIGCDHDTVCTGKYTYFYDQTVLKNKDLSVDEENNTNFSVELENTYYLFQQYRHIQRLAGSIGCSIYNASPVGLLDVFERVSFEELLNL
jgi:hypothetical protein